MIVSARNLLEDGAISWNHDLTRGRTWGTDGVARPRHRAVEQLRMEYDRASPGF